MTVGAKTLQLNRFQNSGQVQESYLLSNMVSTETDFSSVFRTQKNFLSTSPCSTQFFQQFSHATVFLEIPSSRAITLIKTSDLNHLCFTELAEPTKSPVFFTFGHGLLNSGKPYVSVSSAIFILNLECIIFSEANHSKISKCWIKHRTSYKLNQQFFIEQGPI